MGENAVDEPIPINQDPIVKPTRRLQTSAVEPQRGSFPYREWRQAQQDKMTAAPAAVTTAAGAPGHAPKPPASSSPPRHAHRAKPKRRRRSVLGIVVIIVFIVLVVTTFASAGKDLFEDIFSTDVETVVHQIAADRSDEAASPTDEDEAFAAGLLEDRLESLKNADAAAVDELASGIDASFADATGATLAECGVDPHEIARTMLEGFDYSIAYISAYDGEDTGYVSADVDCRLWYQTMVSTESKVEALEEDPTPAEVGALLLESAEETPIERDQYVSVDIVRVDGTWTIDEESWAEELKWLFWL